MICYFHWYRFIHALMEIYMILWECIGHGFGGGMGLCGGARGYGILRKQNHVFRAYPSLHLMSKRTMCVCKYLFCSQKSESCIVDNCRMGEEPYNNNSIDWRLYSMFVIVLFLYISNWAYCVLLLQNMHIYFVGVLNFELGFGLW